MSARPIPLLWLAVALVALAEAGIAALVLVPRVDPAYRAYYIERTSDCWPHETAGTYALGTTLSFIARSGNSYVPNKVCGWFYSDKGGTWSYGRYSLLRFVFPPVDGALRLTVAAAALVDAAHPQQRVAVSANGAAVGTLTFDGAAPVEKTLDIPAALAATGHIELRFDYPDAAPGTVLGPNEDAHLRAVRMVSLRLG